MGVEDISARDREPEFLGTERFALRRRLGDGSFGVVFEAFDQVRNGPVALKWLRYADAEQVFHFKNEFRALAQISHPNLVQLLDLESDGNRWFFTMELIRGVPLPEYFRPDWLPPGYETLSANSGRYQVMAGAAGDEAPEPARDVRVRELDVDPPDVRMVFSQLAAGIHALHGSNKLHRDLKCQNVLVTPDRRVVILDFGMVRELGRGADSDIDVAGTPFYMAPELIGGEPSSPASDWYSFGVMLFRALTEELPFDGPMLRVMSAKQQREAPRASERVRSIPEDLDVLCARLLARDPRARPTGSEILAALGTLTPSRAIDANLDDGDVFVGRRRELRALEVARARTRAGSPAAALVHGPSGIGKTALVRYFLDRLQQAEPTALVLRGRCYERETLPYKALDEVIDQLVAYLGTLTASELAELVPDRVSDLCVAFPSFVRIPRFAESVDRGAEAPDPIERRRRAGEGLEDLLRRLARRRTVIIAIDDLQWGDRDSALLVRPLLSDRRAVPVLWLGTYRTEDAEASAFVSALFETGQREGPADAIVIEVPRLNEEASRTLLELRLKGRPRDEQLLEELTEQAAGSPLLIDLMLRHARDADAQLNTDLASVLRQTIEPLAPQARALLNVMAVRGRPIAANDASHALDVDGLDSMLLAQLRNAKLIRQRGAEPTVELELYHDRIREAVASGLDDDEERRLHGRLARALLARPGADPEALASHFLGAGERAEAFRYTVDAARNAQASLAFEREAQLLESALELIDDAPRIERGLAHAGMDALSLRTELGHALRNAGRGVAAAKAYLRAAGLAAAARALELRRLAAEQYLFSGHLDEGRGVLRGVLSEVGLSMPEHPARVLAEFLARRVQVRLRGTRFVERAEADIRPEVLMKIDTCWSVAIGFAMVDPVLGGIFQARHMLMALDAGEVSRIARAVAVEVPFAATAGSKNDERTGELARLGRDLADRDGSGFIQGLLASSSGGADWLCGRWVDAERLEERALSILRSQCSGVAWQIGSSTVVLLDVLWRMGRWDELLARWPQVLDEATTRGDRLLEIYTRIKFKTLDHMAAGRPEQAIDESRQALARWSQPGFQLLHFWDAFVNVESLLYQGAPDRARERAGGVSGTVRRSGLLQLQMYDITWRDLGARVALAYADSTTGRARSKALDAVVAAAKDIEGSGAEWARGVAGLLRAGERSLSGRPGEAERELRLAERGLTKANMALHARMARLAAARLEGDRRSEREELDALRDLGLAEPERWLHVIAPGRWSR
ncbi:MAG: serine/threonine-protein kinase PknK [Sandaracinaceae bacterium]